MKCPYPKCESEVIIIDDKYFHKDTACAGLGDGINIDIQVIDNNVYQIWLKKVGYPDEKPSLFNRFLNALRMR